MSDWLKGEVARLSVAVTDVAGQAADPDTLALKIKTPDGTTTTYTYPTQITKTGTGAYRYDLPLIASGTWHYRWETGDPTPGAAESRLVVAASSF